MINFKNLNFKKGVSKSYKTSRFSFLTWNTDKIHISNSSSESSITFDSLSGAGDQKVWDLLFLSKGYFISTLTNHLKQASTGSSRPNRNLTACPKKPQHSLQISSGILATLGQGILSETEIS